MLAGRRFRGAFPTVSRALAISRGPEDDPTGISELKTMCANARRVSALCDMMRLGGGEGSSHDLEHDLEHIAPQFSAIAESCAHDGAFILPEEVPDHEPKHSRCHHGCCRR